MTYYSKIPRTKRNCSKFCFRFCQNKNEANNFFEIGKGTCLKNRLRCNLWMHSNYPFDEKTLSYGYGFATVDNAGTWHKVGEKNIGKHSMSECRKSTTTTTTAITTTIRSTKTKTATLMKSRRMPMN